MLVRVRTQVLLAVEQAADGDQHGLAHLLLGDVSAGAVFFSALRTGFFQSFRQHPRPSGARSKAVEQESRDIKV